MALIAFLYEELCLNNRRAGEGKPRCEQGITSERLIKETWAFGRKFGSSKP